MKKEAKGVKVRHLKITSKYRVRRVLQSCTVPELRLCGDWLAAAGFAIGGRVEVVVKKDQLTIKTKTKRR